MEIKTVLVAILMVLVCLVPSVCADTAIIYPVHDGGLYRSGSELTWTNLIAVNPASTVVNNNTGVYNDVEIDAGTNSNTFIGLGRHVLTFNNMSTELGAGATITAGYLSWTGEGGANQFTGFNNNFVLVAGTPTDPITLTTSDFNKFTTTALSAINKSSTTNPFTHKMDLNAAGITFLGSPNNGIYNTFYMIYDDDRSGSFSGTWGADLYAYEFVKQLKNANVAYRPSLTLTYTSVVAPVASFTKDKTGGTSPVTVVFTDTSTNTPTSWYWVFGDGSSTNSTVKNSVHTFTGAGTYNVNLTATNSAGSSTTATQAILVGVPPVASFTKDKTSGVSPLTVQFTDTSSGAVSYYWVFGDGSTSTVQSPSHQFAGIGTYHTNLTATNTYGSDTTATQAITVGNPPDAGFTAVPLSGNAPLFVSFASLGATGSKIDSWYYVSSDGQISTLSSPTLTFNKGIWNVNLTTSNSTYSISNTSATQAITSIFEANYTATPISGNEPLSVQFTDYSLGAPTGWFWQFGDGITSILQSPLHNYPTYGLYSPNLTITKAGVTNDTKERVDYIDVIQGIPTNALWTPSVPSGTLKVPPTWQDVWFNATSSSGIPSGYDWYIDGFHVISPVQNEDITFATNGTFWVNLTVFNGVGSSTYNHTYNVLGSKPKILGLTLLTASAYYYPPTPAINFYTTYDDTYGDPPVTYLWNFGDGVTYLDTPAPGVYHSYASHSYTNYGTFTVSVTETNVWGSDVGHLTYVVLTPPPQSMPVLKWIDANGKTITSAYTDTNVSFSFDTVGNGINPPLGFVGDYFRLNFYEKDISTGNWILQTNPGYWALTYGNSVFGHYTSGQVMAAQGVYRWIGYVDENYSTEKTVRIELVAVNVTLGGGQSLGKVDLAVTNNPIKFSNVGGWANDVGGVGLKLIIAALIVLGLVVAPYVLMRAFNPYIEVIMAILGIGFCYYLGLIDLWIIFGLGVIAAVVIFFMSRGGGGGAIPVEAGGELG